MDPLFSNSVLNTNKINLPAIKSLDTPVQFLTGVGPHRASLLAKLNIHTIEDLLYFFPREHQDRHVQPIRNLRPGLKMAVKGEIISAGIKQIGATLGQAKALIQDASAS